MIIEGILGTVLVTLIGFGLFIGYGLGRETGHRGGYRRGFDEGVDYARGLLQPIDDLNARGDGA